MKFEKIKVKVIFCGILFCIKTEKLNMESYRGHNGQSRNRRADGLFFPETPANHPGLFRFKKRMFSRLVLLLHGRDFSEYQLGIWKVLREIKGVV